MTLPGSLNPTTGNGQSLTTKLSGEITSIFQSTSYSGTVRINESGSFMDTTPSGSTLMTDPSRVIETLNYTHLEASTAIILNVPMIAGISSGAGVLVCSFVVAVVVCLRRRTKPQNAVAKEGTQLAEFSKNNTPLANPIDSQTMNLSHRYGHLPQNSERSPSGEYYSARTNPDLSHYSDPAGRMNELYMNPPQATYGDADELNRLNEAMLEREKGSGSNRANLATGGTYLNSPHLYVQMPEGFGQAPAGQYNTLGQSHDKSHYSDPNERIRELERNPPQANYVSIQEAM